MAYVPTPDIIIEHDGPVAIITLNQPEQRNAFSDAMHDGLVVKNPCSRRTSPKAMLRVAPPNISEPDPSSQI